MLSFVTDYCEGAHPEILEKLCGMNLEKQAGYADSVYVKSASEKIRKACECPDGDVWFLTGGTQTNLIAADTMLLPYEGVVAAVTGHVAVHEAGAIEHTGHKVLAIPGEDGKLSAEAVSRYLDAFEKDENREHMVYPGMVYISQPTELGTLYTKEELAALHEVCVRRGMPLYMDGARLAEALAADPSLTLPDIARLTDAFYIGGTKCGALFGEALIFTKKNTPSHFLTRIKQHGALLAKGWLIALQFDVLFENELYVRGGENALRTAEIVKKALKEKGYRFFIDSPTNQIFVVMENEKLAALSGKAEFGFWAEEDDRHTVIRIVTSFATTEEDAAALAELL